MKKKKFTFRIFLHPDVNNEQLIQNTNTNYHFFYQNYLFLIQLYYPIFTLYYNQNTIYLHK